MATKKKPKMRQMTFQKIDGSVIILRKNGVYSQHEAWTRADEVFVKSGSGFQSIRRNGTSVQGVALVDYDLGDSFEYAFTATGRMVLSTHDKAEEKTSSVMDH